MVPTSSAADFHDCIPSLPSLLSLLTSLLLSYICEKMSHHQAASSPMQTQEYEDDEELENQPPSPDSVVGSFMNPSRASAHHHLEQSISALADHFAAWDKESTKNPMEGSGSSGGLPKQQEEQAENTSLGESKNLSLKRALEVEDLLGDCESDSDENLKKKKIKDDASSEMESFSDILKNVNAEIKLLRKMVSFYRAKGVHPSSSTNDSCEDFSKNWLNMPTGDMVELVRGLRINYECRKKNACLQEALDRQALEMAHEIWGSGDVDAPNEDELAGCNNAGIEMEGFLSDSGVEGGEKEEGLKLEEKVDLWAEFGSEDVKGSFKDSADESGSQQKGIENVGSDNVKAEIAMEEKDQEDEGKSCEEDKMMIN